jgi:hypothetical protein
MKNRTITLDIKEEKEISKPDKVTNFLLKNKGKFFTTPIITRKALKAQQCGNNNNIIFNLVDDNKIECKKCECGKYNLYGIK